jgi:hypothetical protein
MLSLSRRIVVRLLLLLLAILLMGPPSSIASEELPLAIRGYDPVAYFTLGRPVPGLAGLEYQWDEHRYRFARPEHRELFMADPVRYAPEFANYCAMALTRGEIHEANPEYWLISDGKLYIFSGPTGPDRFRQALTENLIKANQNKALVQKR